MHLSEDMTIHAVQRTKGSDFNPCAAMVHPSVVLRVNLSVQFAIQDLVMGPLTEFVDYFHD